MSSAKLRENTLMKRLIAVVLLSSLSFTLYATSGGGDRPEEPTSNLIEIDFGRWNIIYNCEKRGYEYFTYSTVPDSGLYSRFKPFHQETQLPKHCRQFSTDTYKQPEGAQQYHRGHGVHQNIWDHDETLMKQSNSFANIVPHAAYLNSYGVWRVTEKLTECYRDKGTVTVWGGNIWGNDSTNDKFLVSHGVVTPDRLWKVIEFPDGEVQAWLMPNDDSPKSKLIDNYLVSPKTISEITGLSFPISASELNEKDKVSKKQPKGCSIK